MSDQFRDREHGSDDCNDVDHERTEDQAEDTVEDIGLHRFNLRLQAQLGLAQLAAQIGDLAAKLGDVRLGGEIGPLRPCLDRRDDSLGLRLVEAGFTQSFRDFQGIDRHPEQPEAEPIIESRSSPRKPWHGPDHPSEQRRSCPGSARPHRSHCHHLSPFLCLSRGVHPTRVTGNLPCAVAAR
jgi:hypothetical protein